MTPERDELYHIFEHHLLNAIVEDEGNTAFLDRVVQDYLASMRKSGVIAATHVESIAEDLKEEVLEMLRKKTYGHYNLAAFRRAKGIVADASASTPLPTEVRSFEKEKGRRSRRPC